MSEKIFKKIRWIYPRSYIKWIEKNLLYAGIGISLERFCSIAFLYSIAIAFITIPLLAFFKLFIYIPIAFIAAFAIMQVVFNSIIVLIGEKKGSFAESVLPDALQLMAANIRSGLTPDKALLLAARPEFGVLEKEIKLAASKAVAGESIENALLTLGDRIKSRIINRTFMLIVEGMKKGGEIADLLEQTADDIRDLKILKKEINAQVGMYVIFIFMAIGFAAPLLFAFSSHLVTTMATLGANLNLEASAQYAKAGPIKISVVKINPSFLTIYSLMTLSVIAFFGSLILGLIQEGREIAGMKYIPIILTLDISIYMTVRLILSSFFGLTGTPTGMPF